MDSNLTISLITSFIAIVVACISGIFSYLSTKRSTSVEKSKAYIQFLQHKMGKLEEALFRFDKDSKNNSCYEETYSSVLANEIHNRFKMTSSYLSAYSYLFTFTIEQYIELEKKYKAISLSFATYIVRDKWEGADIKEEYKDELLPMEKLPIEMSQFSNNIRSLFVDELRQTYEKFEKLSIK